MDPASAEVGREANLEGRNAEVEGVPALCTRHKVKTLRAARSVRVAPHLRTRRLEETRG